MKNSTMLIANTDIWRTSGMIVPAIMTLICFICTAVSLTVSGFICLRDREAQDESDNKAKHHREQEFVSKVLGLFYKIRTSNVFRIKEIMQDLNDERPVWIGAKSDIVSNLEYYGIFLTETEKSKLLSTAEVFEIGCESLFYFELERFSKAQAVYGSNVLNFFECIQQDGAAFPREFYPDIKSIFHIDIIYNVFTEMQVITELFVLLATGIDLEIISVTSIPPQFRHSQLGNELSKIKDFLYNYYLRVFPRERSTANVMRKLPQLPMIYEATNDDKIETIETIVEVEEPIEDNVFEQPKATDIGSVSSINTLDSIPAEIPSSSRSGQRSPPIALPPPSSMSSTSTPSPRFSSTSSTSRGRRLSQQFGKQRLKVRQAYKTISQRVKQRPNYQEESGGGDIEETSGEGRRRTSEPLVTNLPAEPQRKQSEAIIRTLPPEPPRQVRFDESNQASSSTTDEPVKKITRKAIKKRVPVVTDPEETQEALFEAMRWRYKAPAKREGSARRRGRLSKQETIQHNAFTYMVTRVIGFLQEKGHLSDKELNSEVYWNVDRNFII